MHGKYNSDEDYDLFGYTYVEVDTVKIRSKVKRITLEKFKKTALKAQIVHS